jgi:GNAT superfamily N-acetyltransferase
MAFRGGAQCADKGARKASMAARVAAGVPIGLLFSDGAQDVGWCSVAPRGTYQGIGGPDPVAGATVWTIACLHLRRDRRGGGFVSQMIRAAEDYARANGATVIEATPVDAESPSFRFMGRVTQFAALGYAEVAMAGKRRHVMRKELRP